MPNIKNDAPFTEPTIVPTLYLTGISVNDGGHVLRFVGWELLTGDDETEGERRIVIRFVMPIDEARKLMRDMTRKLPGREN